MKLSDSWNVKLIIEEPDRVSWQQQVKGLEDLPEGSVRCAKCIEFRLKATAAYAKKNGFQVFSTTLTTSPKKNSKTVLEIGESVAKKFAIEYLHRDFKKKNGFLRSVVLSKELGLYRQNYCGCIYSLRNRAVNGGCES